MIRKIYVQISNLHHLDLKERIVDYINPLDGIIRVENVIKGHRLWIIIDTDRITEKELVVILKQLGAHVAKIHRIPMVYTHQKLLQWLSFVGIIHILLVYLFGFLLSTQILNQLPIYIILVTLFLSFQGIFWYYTRSLSPQIFYNIELTKTFRSLGYISGFTSFFLLLAISGWTLWGWSHSWFLLMLSLVGWIFSLQSLYSYQKNKNLLERSLDQTLKNINEQYVMINNKRTPSSAILEGDIFILVKDAIVPVDAEVIFDFVEDKSGNDSMAKRYILGTKFLAGSTICDDGVPLKALSRTETSLLAQRIIYNKGEALPSSTAGEIKADQDHFIFIAIFFILSMGVIWVGSAFTLPWQWDHVLWKKTIFLYFFLTILYNNAWNLWLKSYNIGWLMNRLKALNILHINIVATKRFLMLESVVIHQDLLPLVMEYDNATIMASDVRMDDAHSIWMCYVRKAQFHNDFPKSMTLTINDSACSVFCEYDFPTNINDQQRAVMYCIMREVKRLHQTLFFIYAEQEFLGYALVSHRLPDDVIFFIDKVSEFGFRPIIFSRLPQGIINDLAREVGVLEAYGSCSSTRSMEILEEFTKKEQAVIYIGQKKWNVNTIKKGQHFFLASIDSSKVFVEKSDLVFHDFSIQKILESLLVMRVFSNIFYKKPLKVTFWIMLFMVCMIGILSYFNIDLFIDSSYGGITPLLGIAILGYSIFFVILAMNNLKFMIKYGKWLKALTTKK